jgi:hypothetical protein
VNKIDEPEPPVKKVLNQQTAEQKSVDAFLTATSDKHVCFDKYVDVVDYWGIRSLPIRSREVLRCRVQTEQGDHGRRRSF